MVVFGTRPEAIKLAPLVHLLAAEPDLDPVVVVTGQHREMLDQVNEFFGVEPQFDLDLMTHGATPNAVARRVLRETERLLATERPDAVMVQGDTTSAFAASLAGFLAGVPVVHVEAGLRTGNRLSPFPEEANRRLTAVVAALHLAPTPRARDNLLAEGIDPASVLVTGNTVVDALQWAVDRPVAFTDARLAGLGGDRPLVLVTTHRRESWGEPMQQAMSALGEVARAHPEIDLLLPLHRNTVVRDAVMPVLEGLANVVLTEPLSYPEFVHLMGRAHVVVTDSGGVQEEAPGLGTPVLVLRESTERPEGVSAGVVRLVGTDPDRVRDELERLLVDADHHDRMAMAANPYGDGQAARRCVAGIRMLLDGTPAPDEFVPVAQGPARADMSARAEVDR